MKFPISRRFSRRGKLPAAAAYENHAAWRRSAAADNTEQNRGLRQIGFYYSLNSDINLNKINIRAVYVSALLLVLSSTFKR